MKSTMTLLLAAGLIAWSASAEAKQPSAAPATIAAPEAAPMPPASGPAMETYPTETAVPAPAPTGPAVAEFPVGAAPVAAAPTGYVHPGLNGHCPPCAHTGPRMHGGNCCGCAWCGNSIYGNPNTSPYLYCWHGGYSHTGWGTPVALVVPPTAEYETHWGWGVGNTRINPIGIQFGRNYGGPGSNIPGAFRSTPRWPSDTDQFGVYYVRGPW
jgi:hypothetical protein